MDKSILEEVLGVREESLGIRIHQVKEVPCTKPGDNYMSVVGLLEFQGTLPGGVPYSGSVFVKRQVDSQAHKQMFSSQEAFTNEVTMYKEVFPMYDVTLPCPRYLYASNDVICLDNLHAEGYSMANRRLGFDLEQASQVLKALARIHVASYKALVTNREDFSTVVKKLKQVGFLVSSQQALLLSSMSRATRQLQAQGVDEALTFLKTLGPNVKERLKTLREPKHIEVLGHGDFWINNILIRKGKNPVKIVDFQACSIVSPAVDVWSFLYTSIQASIMEHSLEELLQEYCSSFLEEMMVQKVTPGDKVSLELLQDELHSKELYGYLVGLMYVPAIVMSEHNIPDVGTLSKDVYLDDSFMDQFMSPDVKGKMCHLSSIGIKRGLFRTDKV